MNIIDFENIDVGYDEKIILKDINLKIKEKEHWAIIGANGSGKSTLMKLIQSELHPRQNKVFKREIFGKANNSVFELKKQLGIITNDLHNYFSMVGSFLTAYQMVLSGYYSSIGVFQHQDFTEEQHVKAIETMQYLEIEHLKTKKVNAMSTGELRKCLVARALIHNPKAFILDEPTVGLDIKAQVNFLKMIQKLSHDCTIILVTHHLEEIFEEIQNVALMYNNTIYKSGKKEEILTSENLSEIFDANVKINVKSNRYYVEEIL